MNIQEKIKNILKVESVDNRIKKIAIDIIK